MPMGGGEKNKIKVFAATPGDNHKQEDEEKKPITNARLADLMKSSLSMRDSTPVINQKSQVKNIIKVH